MEKERAKKKRKKKGNNKRKGGQARQAVDADENIQRNSFPSPSPALQKSGRVMGTLGEELFGVQTHTFMSHSALDRLGVRIGKERIPARSWLAPYWVSWAIQPCFLTLKRCSSWESQMREEVILIQRGDWIKPITEPKRCGKC